MASRRRRLVDWHTQPLRALLFAPGDDERKLAKVGQFGADAVVLDLEDAVADARKDLARERVLSAVADWAGSGPLLVRVNNFDSGRLAEDVRSVVHPNLDGLLLPKAEHTETLVEVATWLDELESASGIAPGAIALFPLIETALGIVRCDDIALSAPTRVVTLVFGLGDFARDMRLQLSAAGDELLYARSRVVTAARAGQLRAPIDGPYFDLRDAEGLVADTQRSRQLGFEGRVVVYPPQVERVQRAYSFLAPAELERNRQIVEAFKQAEAAGSAAIQVDGMFVDYPVFQHAAETLRRHEALQSDAGP
jgi:citrate lyase subunit beta/citryl-CoA lyase